MTADSHAFRVLNEIGIIAQLSRTAFERVLPDGMSLAQFSVLNHFVRLGRDSAPARLANAFQVSKQTMTHTLRRLSAAGHVTIRADGEDRRAKVVAITPAGVAARHAAVAALAPMLEALGAGFGDAAFRSMLPALSRLRATLDMARD